MTLGKSIQVPSSSATGLLHRRPSRPHRIVSLFTGAMGLDLGLERAGFQTAVAVECNPVAVATIQANRPGIAVIDRPIESVSTAEILKRASLEVGEVELLAGGPACQSFSTAGKRRSLSDPLGLLFYEFMRVVDEARPAFFLMENVRGLLSAAVRHRPLARRGGKHPPLQADEELGSAFRAVTDRIRKSGYYVLFDVLDAADFGTPQTRRRLVIIGSRDGVPLAMPSPSHSNNGSRNLIPWRTLKDAIQHLEDAQAEYIEFVPSRRRYFAHVPPGGNWRNLPPELQVAALGAASKSWGGRSGFFRRLSWDRPSPTLNTNPDSKATALCHPTETRPLSVREYARIQGFPDDWDLRGSTRQKYRQLGNAVPIPLAEALGFAIRSAARRRGRAERLGEVECWNLDLLNSMSARPRTRLNPPRMRGPETPAALKRWRDGKSAQRNDARAYAPSHLSAAVGKGKVVKKIASLLHREYGSPDLGNYDDPVDELFFILLSQRTTDPSYTRVFGSLKQWVSDWNNLHAKTVAEVSAVIASAGLKNQKAAHILGIANRLRADFGEVTLEHLAHASDTEVEAYLTSLPGIGVKSAKCVMLFSMGRDVLPVDSHVARFAHRIGIVNSAASKARVHDVVEAAVPPQLRRSFHVNAIAHGRKVCRSQNPQCVTCPVKRMCQHAKKPPLAHS